MLSVDGKAAARKTLEHTIPITLPEDETFDIGQDTQTGVALIEHSYDPPVQVHGQARQADVPA